PPGEDTVHLEDEEEMSEPEHRPHEVLEVAEKPMLSDSLQVEIHERDQGQGDGGREHSGRRLEKKEEPEEVRDEDEDREGPDHGKVSFLSPVPDDVLEQAADPFDDHLEEVLDSARPLPP